MVVLAERWERDTATKLLLCLRECLRYRCLRISMSIMPFEWPLGVGSRSGWVPVISGLSSLAQIQSGGTLLNWH